MIIMIDPNLKLPLLWALMVVLVGGIFGWLTSLRSRGFGLFGNIAIGILGAAFGSLVGALAIGWVFPRLGIHLGIGIARPLIDATIGAVIGAWIFSAISRQALSKSTP